MNKEMLISWRPTEDGGQWSGFTPCGHLTVARQAAALERARDYALARLSWLEAARLAVLLHNRHWCESRAMWCEKRANLARLGGE